MRPHGVAKRVEPKPPPRPGRLLFLQSGPSHGIHVISAQIAGEPGPSGKRRAKNRKPPTEHRNALNIDELVLRHPLSIAQRGQICEAAFGPVDECLNVGAEPVQFVCLDG